MNTTLIGTTFSSIHAQYLRLPLQAFDELLDLQFDIIRIGTYWNLIEKKQGVYDFNEVKKMLEKCEIRGQKVILTLGMKSPRWPEFHLPEWLKTKTQKEITEHLLHYFHQFIEEFKTFHCIQYWQLENEPLDPSGPENNIVPLEILEQEFYTIKKLDSRPILGTVWGNELGKRGLLNTITKVADIIGIDLYYHQFLKRIYTKSFYKGPRDSSESIQTLIRSCEKPVWISELQAEPWEASMAEYKGIDPKSMSSNIIRTNFNNAYRLNPEAILLWGYEYWYYQKMKGDEHMWHAIKEILERMKS